MNSVLKASAVGLMLVSTIATTAPASFADNTDPPKTGHITGKTVVGGVLSLLVWPGIGQAMNSNKGSKVATHAIIGLFPPFRFWSGYDALVNRQGGYWNGKI